MRSVFPLLVALPVSLLGLELAAQDTVAVSVGDRLRITSREFGVQQGQGTFTKRLDDRIAVRRKGDSTDTWIVPVNSLNAVDVWRRHKGHRTLQGAGIGALLGTVAFETVRRTNKSTCTGSCSKKKSVGSVVSISGAIVGGLAGAGVGRLLNAAGWDRVYSRP